MFEMIGSEGQYAPNTITDALGNVVRMNYNGLGDLVQLTEVAATAGIDRITSFTYTPEGWPSRLVRADGSVFTTLYNPDGRVSAKIDPRGVREEYRYDPIGRLKTITLGAAATSDGKAALNQVINYKSDTFVDQLLEVSVKDRNGVPRKLAAFTYDGHGRVTSEVADGRAPVVFKYDGARNFLTQVSFGSLVVSNRFDRLGRLLTQVIDPNGRNLSTEYRYSQSKNGDLRASDIIDANGNTTQRNYDVDGLLQSVIDAKGFATGYRYNYLNQLIQTSPGDATGALVARSTVYTVDKLGRILSLIRDGQTESMAYAPNGQLKRKTDFGGQTIDYSYDDVGRLVGIDYSGTVSDPAGARSDAQFTYFANDFLKTASSRPDGIGSKVTSYDYDAMNRLLNRTRNSRVLGYSYNDDSTLRALDYWGRTGVQYDYREFYGYDLSGRVQSLTAFGQQSDYSYTDNGQLGSVARLNGVISVYAYDSANRLIGNEHSKGGAALASVLYALDKNGNRVQSTEKVTANGLLKTGSNSYQYDPLNRLIQANLGGVPGVADALNQSYGYDSVGNRLTVTPQ